MCGSSFVLEHYRMLLSVLVLHEVLLAGLWASEEFALVSLFEGKDRKVQLVVLFILIV